MNLTKPDETTEHTLGSRFVHAPDWGALSRDDSGDPITGEAGRIVEHAWSMKAMIRWTRNDRGPFNALRWRLWDRFNAGRPPSRIQSKAGTLGIVNEDGTVTERSPEGYLRPLPTFTGG